MTKLDKFLLTLLIIYSTIYAHSTQMSEPISISIMCLIGLLMTFGGED